jgi:hypothetical protein
VCGCELTAVELEIGWTLHEETCVREQLILRSLLSFTGQTIKTSGSFEILVPMYHCPQCHISEDSYSRENHGSHTCRQCSRVQPRAVVLTLYETAAQ